jgi:hypothetical protein
MRFLLRQEQKMLSELCKAATGVFALPLVLTGILALAILIKTSGAEPWKKKYGAAAWDFSQSFAANLAALTGAINAIVAAATLTAGADLSKKVEVMLGIAVFVIFTACAPLIASVWKTPANETFFGGVVAGISVTALGVFGQMQALIKLASAQPSGLARYAIALYFADFAVFIYCLATANRLAHTPPVKSVTLEAKEGTTVLDRWAFALG